LARNFPQNNGSGLIKRRKIQSPQLLREEVSARCPPSVDIQAGQKEGEFIEEIFHKSVSKD